MIEKQDFGTTKDGKKATKYILTNEHGMKAAFTDFGAHWVEMWVPDKEGNMADVILGYDDVSNYEKPNPHFGAPIGRYANRIAEGKFSIDGKNYQIAQNEGTNSLHSGPDFWHIRMWKATEEESKLGSKVIFSLHSDDGDQGYPGNVDVQVSYTLTTDDMVMIEYNFLSDKDTPYNMTNHCYFNLAGHNSGNILNQSVWICSDYFTPADEKSIPTGEVRSVEGTPMDFTSMKRIGEDIDSDYECIVQGHGFDHNWIIKKTDENMQLIAKASDFESGRTLKVYTDLPGMQFYTGNFIKDTDPIGKGGCKYPRRGGYCFETQYYPNSINMPEWPQPIAKAGVNQNSFTAYKFSVKKDETESEEEK